MSLPIRPGRETDMAFVVSAWLNNLAQGYRDLDRDHFRQEMTRTIRRLRDRGELRVAYDPADDDHLVGFACFTPSNEGTELHYVYVKLDFRGQGIARALLEGVNVTSYTFLPPTARPRKGWRHTPRFTI